MKSPCCQMSIFLDDEGNRRCSKYGCLKIIGEPKQVPLWTEPKEVERPYVIGEDADCIDYGDK